jgi:hypothetical protein
MRALLVAIFLTAAAPTLACDRDVSTGLISALLDRNPNRFYVTHESTDELVISMDRKFWSQQSQAFKSGFVFSYGCALRGKRMKVTIIER